MKYQIFFRIVGPFLPDSYEVSDLVLFRDQSTSISPQISSEVSSSEQHLEGKSVNHRIFFNADKPRFRRFSSEHVVKVTLEANTYYEAMELASLRLDQLVEALTMAAFSVAKMHPTTGKEVSLTVNDIYQYQIEKVIDDQGNVVEGAGDKIELSSTGVNYFPKPFPSGFENEINDVLRCNDETLRKLMFYLKRAKHFSYEYYSELEVFMNSMKCIELLANTIRPENSIRKKPKGFYALLVFLGLRKSKEKRVSFKMKMNGFNGYQGVCSTLGIKNKYKGFAIKGWDARNQMDMAHASEYFRLIAFPFPNDLNYTAYHFVLKYVEYLRVNKPELFWDLSDIDEEWWRMFR